MRTGKGLAAGAALVILIGCHAAEIDGLPEGMVGIWKTSAPKYADRFFELKENDLVSFGTGEGLTQIHPISSVERVATVDGVLYSVHYADIEEEEYTFNFFWDSSMSGVIRIKNQIGIEWTKAGDPE